VEGKAAGVRVPFREITLQPTRQFDGRVEENEPLRVYDTSGASSRAETPRSTRAAMSCRRTTAT
jgi:hypothetical protein